MRGDLLIRRARLEGDPGAGLVDVRIAGGRIAGISTSIGPIGGGAEEIDASGGWLTPGIHDHHLHLRALASARSSVVVGPPAVNNPAELAEALRRAGPDRTSGWVRAVGYHESVAGDLDRDVLDGILPDRPLRVQHRSGVLWVLNSVALDVTGADSAAGSGIERDGSGSPTGRLWRMDAWLSARTASLPDAELLGRLGELSREAASRGVTGWTEATPDRGDVDTGMLARAAADGLIRQRLHLMVRRGASFVEPTAGGPVSYGAIKIILDDFDLPAMDELSRTISEAHGAGRPVAVHCVTRTQLVLTLAALEAAGSPIAGDRIEHGSVIPFEMIPELKRLGLVVVTQPNFVFERGDEYLRSVEPGETENLWRAGSLVRAGVRVAAGTDAPFGAADPWAAIRAATSRRTISGVAIGPDERVDVHEALRWWLGTGDSPTRPRRVEAGAVADLTVLPAPLSEVVSGGEVRVIAAVVAGTVVHG